MDLRVLRYFLTVVREKSIVGAAEVLHVTQPTLSRQLKELEEEFGAKLFTRGSRTQGISLTEKGRLLRRRAEELVQLADKTQEEMHGSDDAVRGDLTIGGGESEAMRILAKAISQLKPQYPEIRFHIFSGNAETVKERLDSGLLDFGVFIEPADLKKYESLRLPATDVWGLLVKKDSPLAAKAAVPPQVLTQIPLLVSRQNQLAELFAKWPGIAPEQVTVAATYNLIFNAALLVEEGLGAALCLDKLVNTGGASRLQFVPIAPKAEAHLDFAWKKYQPLSKPAEVFLQKMRQLCAAQGAVR